MPVFTIKFLIGLEPYLSLLKPDISSMDAENTAVRRRRRGRGLEDRLSIASHSVEIMHKYLKGSPSNSAILQQMLSLLMQVWK